MSEDNVEPYMNEINKSSNNIKQDESSVSFFSSNSLKLELENDDKKETNSEVLMITENEDAPIIKESRERMNNILNSHKESEKMIDDLVKADSDKKLNKSDILQMKEKVKKENEIIKGKYK